MAYTLPRMFSAEQQKTCSITASYMAQVKASKETLLEQGFMTETQWNDIQHLGTWGVIKGKAAAGTLEPGGFAILKSVSSKETHLLGWDKENGFYHKVSGAPKKPVSEFYVESLVKKSANQGSDLDWEWLGNTTPKPTIGIGSKSTGAMADEDIAKMFVETKDSLAKEAGINIKGANPLLDLKVYDAIAKVTGYSPTEVKAKVDAYKATGKKLSALKKKTLKAKSPTFTPSPPVSPQPHAPDTHVPQAPLSKKEIDWDKSAKVNLSSSNPLYGNEIRIDGVHVGYVRQIEKTHSINVPGTKYSSGVTKEKVWRAFDVKGNQIGYETKTRSAAIDRIREAGKAGKLDLPGTPKAVPTEAAKDTVKAAEEEAFKSTSDVKYSDEEVSKAYIKAKDQLAADPDNPWTLYTQHNKEFEDNIFNLMEKSYGIEIPPSQIRAQIQRYIGDGNKLSVLKKKMAKTGEYVPKADTLKKSKNAKQANFTPTSKTQAGKQIDEMAGIYSPDGYSPFPFTEAGEQTVFDGLKNSLYAAMNDQSVYEQFVSALNTWKNTHPGASKHPTLLDMVRAYDKKKAAQLGIANGNFYEKKLVNYASSPTGKAHIKAIQEAAELEAKLPPLPSDSAGFKDISPDDARQMQANLYKWTREEANALTTYTGGSYSTINGALRQGGTNATARHMQSGMRPMPRDMLVHRGCNFQQFNLGSYEQALQLVGKEVTEKGFLSTSAGGTPAFSGSVLVDVEIPAGTYGAYVQSISHYYNEKEFVVAAGTRYKVLSVRKEGYQTRIRVRAIPGSQRKF